jgi:hypothetical protein
LSSSTSSSKAVPAEAKPIPSVVPQSPNRAATWSTNQRPRPAGQSGPRFEQTNMELQPNALSAMELVANEPIRLVHGRKAVCDGGISAKSDPPKTLSTENTDCCFLQALDPLGILRFTLIWYGLFVCLNLETGRSTLSRTGHTWPSIMRVSCLLSSCID